MWNFPADVAQHPPAVLLELILQIVEPTAT